MIPLNERLTNYKKLLRIKTRTLQANFFEKYNRFGNRYKSPDKTIIISGEGRGGTTWLAELLLTEKGTGIIWEPLHPAVLKNHAKTRKFGQELGNFPYIMEKANWPEANNYFNSLFKGEYLPYEYIRNYNNKLFSTKRWIVKFCRANMLLPWMVKNCEVNLPIFLLRHPCAVVSSQLRHEAFDDMGMFCIQNSKYNDIFYRYEHILSKVNSRIEMLAAWWAINNVGPLKHPQNNISWITVTYENLFNNPKHELNRIYNRLNIAIPEKIYKNINNPSMTTKRDSMILKGRNQLEGWKTHLDKEGIKKVLDIVNKFEIDIYNDSPEPDYEKVYGQRTDI